MSDKDREQIRRAIETAHIQGIHLDQSKDKVQSGFHPEFRMSVRKGDEIDNVGPEEFLRFGDRSPRKRPVVLRAAAGV